MSVKIKLTRIDKRLLHATVALNWNQFMDVDYVLIVDLNYVKDPFIADVMQLCLPKTMKVKIQTINEFLTFINQESNVVIKAMVIFPNLNIVKEAVSKGFYTSEIQMPYPASRMLMKELSLYFDENEIDCIHYIQHHNIKLYFQTSPFDIKDYAYFKNR